MKRRRYLSSGAAVVLAGALAGCLGSGVNTAELSDGGGDADAGPTCPDATTVGDVARAQHEALADVGPVSVTLRRGDPDDPLVTNEVVLDVAAGRLHQVVDVDPAVADVNQPIVPPYYPGGVIVDEDERPPLVRLERFRRSDDLLADLEGEATFRVERTGPDGDATRERESVDGRTPPTAEYGCLGHLARPFPGSVTDDDAIESDEERLVAAADAVRSLGDGDLDPLADLRRDVECLHGYVTPPRRRGFPENAEGRRVVPDESENETAGLLSRNAESGLVDWTTYAVSRHFGGDPGFPSVDLRVTVSLSTDAEAVPTPEWTED